MKDNLKTIINHYRNKRTAKTICRRSIWATGSNSKSRTNKKAKSNIR